jgi:hypothetical protein
VALALAPPPGAYSADSESAGLAQPAFAVQRLSTRQKIRAIFRYNAQSSELAKRLLLFVAVGCLLLQVVVFERLKILRR